MRVWTKLALVLLLASGGAACASEEGSQDEGARSASTNAPPPVAAGNSAPSGGDVGVGAMTSLPGTAVPVSSGSAGASAGASSGDFANPAGPAMRPASGVPADSAAEPPVTTSPTPTTNPQSGTLTAGAWDDNRNFSRFTEYRRVLLAQQLPGALPIELEEHRAAHEQFAADLSAHERLDIALVVDTTGSMSDEIDYLQAELTAMSNEIRALYPDAQQRWALIAYRDHGDAYVVQRTDFASDIQAYRAKLDTLTAAGGGDIPEAPDMALGEMISLEWRAEPDVARLAFWVADAPHHDEHAQALAESIREARELGIHIYPVASSGVDELTELTMRSSAQLTGGRYLFLTDDSGVGGAHKEPTIPCYFVTRLDRAIVRMVDIEMSGLYHEPAEADVIRTGGDPQNGACQLESGDEVIAF